MKSNKNYFRKINRSLFHFTEEDKQNTIISTLSIQISYGWLMATLTVMEPKVFFVFFIPIYTAIAYLLYRTLILINRKWKFSLSTTGDKILCYVVTSIYAIAMIAVYVYGILSTKTSLLLTIPAGIVLIFGCVLFLYRKNHIK